MRIKFGQREPDIAVLMLVSGWVYKWNLKSVKEIGGNGRANDICVHGGVLYEAEPSGVISWQTAELIPTAGWTTAICSHGGKLYHSVATRGRSDPSRIYETLTGKQVAERRRMVTTLCSHSGRLFDGGEEGVYDTFADRRITDRAVNVLCAHAGALYDGSYLGICETLSGTVVVARRPEVIALCSHEGVLYDAVEDPRLPGGIYNSLQGIVALDYASIVHITKTRTVMGYRVKGGRHNVQAIRGMISVPRAVVARFEAPLRDYKINLGK